MTSIHFCRKVNERIVEAMREFAFKSKPLRLSEPHYDRSRIRRLQLHVVLVVARANFGNPFAVFVAEFASNVSLGLGNLFTLGDERVRLARNEGLAAVLWLLIGAALTVIIANVFVPELGGWTMRRRRVQR